MFFLYSRKFLVLIFILSTLNAISQTDKIENLKNQLKTAGSETRLTVLLALCEEWESYNSDNLLKYIAEIRQIAASKNDQDAKLLAEYYTAVFYFQKNKVDTSQQITDAALEGFKKNKSYNDTYLKLIGLKRNILLRTAHLNEALAMDYDLLKVTEAHKDTFGILKARVGIGNIYLKLKKYDDCLQWYRSALAMMKNDEQYKKRLSFFYNNISILFYHLKKEDSCLYYVKQGIRYSEQGQNLTNLANALFLFGGILAEFSQPRKEGSLADAAKLKEAEKAFTRAVEVRKKIGDIYYIIADMAQLGIFYSNLPDAEKGIAVCKEGLLLAKKHGQTPPNLQDLYEALKRNYKLAGDHKNYGETVDQLLGLKDSLYKVNTAEKLAELQTKYEVQKKENTIIQQQLALSNQQFAISRKNYLFYGSLLLSLLIIVIGFLIFNGYRRKQKMKMEMMQEEDRRLAEQAVKEAEEAERKRIAADLHDNLGAYAASIVSNLEFIKTKNEDKQTVTAMRELRNNSFSIVSQLSDTIWALKKDALSLTSISDRIKTFIQRIQPSYPRVQIYVTESISRDAILPPSQAFHLFQLIQEAVNNALRHSECARVNIRIESGERWSIAVIDDGIGMHQKNSNISGGNGLQNMRERAAIGGWQIEWIPEVPTGTRVVITSSAVGQVMTELQ